jgi:hypothetical protein
MPRSEMAFSYPPGQSATVSTSALANLLDALDYTRQRLERARESGGAPAWERYYWLLADAGEGLCPSARTAKAPGALPDGLNG